MSLTRLRALPLQFVAQLREERAALDVLRARRDASELTADQFEDAVLELVLARVANLPPPIVGELRQVLREALHTDPYFVELCASVRGEPSHEG